MTSIIRIAAALLLRADGDTLLVRKRGTQAFIQPGGKIEPGENPTDALVRELREELGLVVHPLDFIYLGCFAAPAVNEINHAVEAELYRLHVTVDVLPASEIEEAVWIDPLVPTNLTLAPLTHGFALPLARGASASRQRTRKWSHGVKERTNRHQPAR